MSDRCGCGMHNDGDCWECNNCRDQRIDESYALRGSVKRMAKRMEMKLRERDDRPCWRKDSPHVLLKWLRGEVDELERALAEWQRQRIEQGLFGADYEPVLAEAADICNYAMMLADVVEGINDEIRGKRQ